MPYKVKIYEGEDGSKNKKVPLGVRVDMECLKICVNSTNHHIFFDNFFTSYNLIFELKCLEHRATGTIREYRTKACAMKSVTEVKKDGRGSYDYRSDGDVEIVRWNDKSVATLCSNAS